jgi:hypothetical protein
VVGVIGSKVQRKGFDLAAYVRTLAHDLTLSSGVDATLKRSRPAD